MTVQSLEALAKANEIRLRMSAVKRQVRAGEMSVEDAMGKECVASMRLGDLLTAQRWWGPRVTPKFLSPLGLSANKTVGALTPRQRGLVVGALRQKNSRGRGPEKP